MVSTLIIIHKFHGLAEAGGFPAIRSGSSDLWAEALAKDQATTRRKRHPKNTNPEGSQEAFANRNVRIWHPFKVHSRRLNGSGGIARASLDPRLIAVKPSASKSQLEEMGIMIRVSTMGPCFRQILRPERTPQAATCRNTVA